MKHIIHILVACTLATILSAAPSLVQNSRKKAADTQKCLEIELNNPDGKAIKLSDTYKKNKYTLIDFWASWCGPCMGEVPYLVDAYAEYHSKGFEIYGVSLDREKDPWVNAISKNKMDWKHVSDLKFWDCVAARAYNVNSIPANYLVDSKGNIVARNLRGPALSQTLSKLLK